MDALGSPNQVEADEPQAAMAAAEPKRPRALPPSAQVLARLSVHDRELLARVLSEPVPFVDHPSFDDRAAGTRLFGATAEQFAAPRPWCNLSDSASVGDPVPRKSSTASLTHEGEQTLFQRLNFARRRLNALLERAAGRRLTAAEAAELLVWHTRAVAARAAIVEANMPLVLAMAKRARLGNIDYAELISEGNMALLRSVDKFDWSRGFKFSTYACRAILKSFSRVAIRTSRYRARFPTEFDPTLEKSDHLDRTRDGVEVNCVSELKAILTSNRADLTDIEHRVLVARFALDQPAADGQMPVPKTLEQVGELIGVTKERVRQIQNKALAKLRAALEESILAA